MRKTRLLAIGGLFAALLAVFSQISIPLPFSAVPLSLGVLAVFLIGGLLPPRLALGSVLAYLAMGSLYRKVPGTPLTGPLYKSHRFERGNAIVEFDNASLGLVPIPGQLEGFEMAGKDRVFHPARAVVNGKNRSTVTVQCDRVPEPVAVRYAFRNYMVANLTNSLGFPAFPFRTDNWEE